MNIQLTINQLLSDDHFTYSYSDNGNLLEKTSKLTQDRTTYSWDKENRLTGVKIENQLGQISSQSSSKYDPLDRRVEKTKDGVVTRFGYDGSNLVAELNAQNKAKAIYLHGPGIDNPIAMWRDLNNDQVATANELFFYTKDHLNSVHELTDIDGKLVQRYFYKAYGETKVLKATRGRDTEVLIENPFAFNSREWEREAEIYCHRARCRDPWSGRWLSPDPIGFEGGNTNFYAYVSQNPVVYYDPEGFVQTIADGGSGSSSVISAGPAVGGLILIDAYSKGGKQNVKDTGLENLTDEEVKELLKNAKGKDRLRYLKDLKGRKERNKQKRGCK